MEELVLANSGEDEFEEIFKLLIAKLWDEQSGRSPRFRCAQSDSETFDTVVTLLKEAAKGWPGILEDKFLPALSQEHLSVCVNALAEHTLADAGLEVMDAFFEFLVARSAKGSKGQYFTPRYVIELCLRILKPKKGERLTDPACGSGGFIFHAFNYVRQQEGLSAKEASTYAQKNLWGFDIDARAIRVAKALMILAGDGSANLMRLNTLYKPEMRGLFEQTGSGDTLPKLSVEDVCRSRMRGSKGFDVIVTNPPFAGEIREREILDSYELSQGKSRIERDALFIERSVDLLNPGGRMAMVLPHNKFAVSSWASARQWLVKRVQIVGVIGLSRNTFLPHTHQKASILIVKKREKIMKSNPDNEEVIFAVSEKAGKDSKGKILTRGEPGDLWKYIDHDFEPIVEGFNAFKF